MRSDPHVFLWGPMGAGKSLVASLVASRAHATLIDVDSEVERRAGATIPELFARGGEASFRELERSVVRDAIARPERAVVALGGGALVDPTLRAEVERAGLLVTLTAALPVLVERLGAANGRPLLGPIEGREARLRELLQSRREAYAAGALRIDTTRLEPAEVAARVTTALADHFFVLRSASADAPAALVRMTSALGEALRDSIDALASTRAVVITDANVDALYGAHIVKLIDEYLPGLRRSSPIVVPPSESTKSIASVASLMEAFAERELDRRAVVIAVGGGVVTDLAGFAASIYMRGVRWVAVPTTTLGMVDAAIGGKTGVDHLERKNLVGAFHLPVATLIDPAFTATETARARASGFSEVIKSLALGDAEGFEALERSISWDDALLRDAIQRGARVKARIVRADPLEQGERLFLNFGHTFGHALESLGGFTRWTHGEAVALGMMCATRLGVHLGLTEPHLLGRIQALLERAKLPVHVGSSDLVRAVGYLGADKKREGASVRFVFLRRVGEPFVRNVSLGDLQAIAPDLAAERLAP